MPLPSQLWLGSRGLPCPLAHMFITRPYLLTCSLAFEVSHGKCEQNACEHSIHICCIDLNDWYSYYRLTMYYYALSLSHAQFLMVNSSWTHAHIVSIISHEHFGPVIQWAHRTTPLLFVKLFLSGSAVRQVIDGPGSANGNKTVQVKPVTVYPPCDTREMAKFSLQDRERIILSVAQFRYVDCRTGTRRFSQLLMSC